MRTRIEVYEKIYPTRKSYHYTIDMTIGRYGRYERVAKGVAASIEEAEKLAEEEAREFIRTYRNSSGPVLRKYININEEEL